MGEHREKDQQSGEALHVFIRPLARPNCFPTVKFSVNGLKTGPLEQFIRIVCGGQT